MQSLGPSFNYPEQYGESRDQITKYTEYVTNFSSASDRFFLE